MRYLPGLVTQVPDGHATEEADQGYIRGARAEEEKERGEATQEKWRQMQQGSEAELHHATTKTALTRLPVTVIARYAK